MMKSTSVAIVFGIMLLVTAPIGAQEAAKPAPAATSPQPATKLNLDYTRTAWFPKFYVPYQEQIGRAHV